MLLFDLNLLLVYTKLVLISVNMVSNNGMADNCCKSTFKADL